MKLWNKIAQDARLIKLLVILNVAQFVVIIGLLVSILTIPTRFTFHIPPDLSNGTTLKANKVPNAYVGQFAFYIWQLINNWQNNAAIDSKNAVTQYQYYLSPSFKYQLKKQDQSLQERGELAGRTRVIRAVSNAMPKVTKISSDKWQVELTVRDSEYVNGIVVKDKNIVYSLIVQQFNGNAQFNPFGLVLDGYSKAPVIKKLVK
jgi:integrating conjugative element protein (TIGR03746 family)